MDEIKTKHEIWELIHRIKKDVLIEHKSDLFKEIDNVNNFTHPTYNESGEEIDVSATPTEIMFDSFLQEYTGYIITSAVPEYISNIAKFTDLSDTPNKYEGNGRKFIRINDDETGLEFVEIDSDQFSQSTQLHSNITESDITNWDGKEDVANKKTDLTDNSDTSYPSVKAVNDAFLKKTLTPTKLVDQGYTYDTVRIGNKLYTVQNFRGTNGLGDEVTDNATWSTLSGAGWCTYNNDPNNEEKYGKLYNWYALDDLVLPAGWRVPTKADFEELYNYLLEKGHNWDGSPPLNEGSLSDNKLGKSVASNGGEWVLYEPHEGRIGNNQRINNSSGFSGLPGGWRSGVDGDFYGVGNSGEWWSVTEENESRAWRLALYRYLEYLSRGDKNKNDGMSVRLVRDVSPIRENGDDVELGNNLTVGGSISEGGSLLSNKYAPSAHTHPYLPLSGGTVGPLTIQGSDFAIQTDAVGNRLQFLRNGSNYIDARSGTSSDVFIVARRNAGFQYDDGTTVSNRLLAFANSVRCYVDLQVDNDLTVGGDLNITGGLSLGQIGVGVPVPGNELSIKTSNSVKIGNALEVENNIWAGGLTVTGDATINNLLKITPVNLDHNDFSFWSTDAYRYYHQTNSNINVDLSSAIFGSTYTIELPDANNLDLDLGTIMEISLSSENTNVDFVVRGFYDGANVQPIYISAVHGSRNGLMLEHFYGYCHLKVVLIGGDKRWLCLHGTINTYTS